METTSHTPVVRVRIGDRVVVRSDRWTVSAIERDGDQAILTLAACAHQRPRTLRVVSPADEVVAAVARRTPRVVGRRAWRCAARRLLASSATAGSLRAASSARMALMPYQLEPALALLGGLGARVLIADAVGLGKTVQALLAVAELRAAGAVRRVLVVCPAGLRDQWAAECAGRVGLEARRLDQAGLRQSRSVRPPDVNPWALDDIVVTSVDYMKRPEVLPLVREAGWDAVIVDEAHGVAGPSERHEAVDAVCREAAYVVLLTATPHNGNESSFRSMCDLGAHEDTLLVFRRTRADAGMPDRRRVHVLRVASSAAERAMHRALSVLTQAIRREPGWADGHRWLLVALLHKRACSGAFALAESVDRRLRALDAGDDVQEQLPLPLDDGGELDGADEAPMWGLPALSDVRRERHLLRDVVSAARLAAEHDSKLERLRRLLDRVREPVIVFTEYRDTLLHLHRQVAPDATTIHGGMARGERQKALEAFTRTRRLLATDAAGEGLNLHQTCRVVVNLELPWNPMRLEQRIGRVDRIGQPHRVHAFHLVSPAAGESRLLERLAARVSTAGSAVGAPDPLGASPTWSEDTAARRVLGLDDEPTAQPATRSAPSTPTVRRAEEAQAECDRLRRVRVGTRRPGAAPAGTAAAATSAYTAAAACPWTPAAHFDAPSTLLVGRSRHRRTRAALHGRPLVLVSSVLEDGAGQAVAVHVTPVLLPPTRPRVDCTAATLAATAVVLASTGFTDWMTRSAAEWGRFVEARLARLGAIARSLEAAHRLHQPGLFDGRASRLHADAARAREARLAYVRGRLEDAQAAAHTTAREPQAALVLLPGWVEWHR